MVNSVNNLITQLRNVTICLQCILYGSVSTEMQVVLNCSIRICLAKEHVPNYGIFKTTKFSLKKSIMILVC